MTIPITLCSRLMCLSWGVALLTLPCASISAAEKNDKQERAAQRRIQQMQQIQQTLEQENATLKQQIKDLEAKLAAGQSTLSKQKQSVSKLQTQNSERDTLLSTCQSAQQATSGELEITLAQKKQLSEESNKEKARLETALSQQ